MGLTATCDANQRTKIVFAFLPNVSSRESRALIPPPRPYPFPLLLRRSFLSSFLSSARSSQMATPSLSLHRQCRSPLLPLPTTPLPLPLIQGALPPADGALSLAADALLAVNCALPLAAGTSVAVPTHALRGRHLICGALERPPLAAPVVPFPR